MALFSIRRNVGPQTRDEMDAAALRAIMCAFEYPGLRWIRSYWDQAGGQITCFYEATDAGQIRDHSRRSRIPCDDVREVVELGPQEYTHG